MALADIVRRIAEDARQEADEIVHTAEHSADELRDQARQRAAYMHDQLVEHGRLEAEAEARTVLARARLSARDRMLAEKRGLVRRVLDGAVERLEALPDDQYAALIAREVKRVMRGDERIVLGQADQPRLAARLPRALADEGLSIEIAGATAAIASGVLLIGERTKAEISVRSLVETHRDRLTAMASDLLFAEAGAEDGEV